MEEAHSVSEHAQAVLVFQDKGELTNDAFVVQSALGEIGAVVPQGLLSTRTAIEQLADQTSEAGRASLYEEAALTIELAVQIEKEVADVQSLREYKSMSLMCLIEPLAGFGGNSRPRNKERAHGNPVSKKSVLRLPQHDWEILNPAAVQIVWQSTRLSTSLTEPRASLERRFGKPARMGRKRPASVVWRTCQAFG
jgi:hypothetical protein